MSEPLTVLHAPHLPHATLIGGHGFIGRHLQIRLMQIGWSCHVAERGDPRLTQEDLGHVFYCAGLTANFRQRPYDTVDAHVHLLSRILQRSTFASLTYLSSTRVYAGAQSTSEDARLLVCPGEPEDLYNLSKLMGESLCLSSRRPVRVVRLSNVYGKDMPEQTFLADVLATVGRDHSVRFRSAPGSQKDYIAVQDVVRALPLIASQGQTDIYNLANGKNVSNAEIAAFLESRGVPCHFESDAPEIVFPVIDISKLRAAIGAPQHTLAEDLPG
ncbi:MAG: NAD-dependent epimerase/dehydratase family protein, partial [Burkholderiales bacterium]|nr:NAD-dependent epimerase/dehydratase family protein [Burkholderiales bacterium]